MEFLRSFLRRHFVGILVVASRNVGCFLRLAESKTVLDYLTWNGQTKHLAMIYIRKLAIMLKMIM